jgi:myo-inositol-1(or 4)-monophosphatase
MPDTPTLSDLENLARQAGEILRQHFERRPGFGRPLQVAYKGLIDPVTEADHLSDAFLLGEITRRFPGHRVVTEESGQLEGHDCCQWFIDPLDGTVNYAHGVPFFAVSIAYAEDGEIRLGVVYDPMQDECFSAERGRGAWLNGEPIRVSQTDDLDRSLLTTGFPYSIRTTSLNNLNNFAHLSLISQSVHHDGSAAMDLCYVAAGRYDGYWELKLGIWDVAAGALIAREAGAVVTDVQGSQDYLQPPHAVLAANPAIHPMLLEVLKGQ